jgi:hypothetical protein
MTLDGKFGEDMGNEFADMSELVDATFDRVDLVGKAANGHRFILAKSEHNNLIPADVVRDFITKANEETMPETEIVKEDLDANTIYAEPAEPAEGDAEVPGSPIWEAIDAATAAKWTAILARAKNAICELKDREIEEVQTGVEYDESGVLSLMEATAAIDHAIGLLAPFAASEKAEAESDMMGAVAKAAASIDVDALAIAEQFAPIVKAGRTLSSANEAALRGAVDSIMKVLNSLPTADVIKADVEEIAKSDDLSGLSDADLLRVVLTGADADRLAALQEIGLRSIASAMAGEAQEEAAEEETEPTEEVEPEETTDTEMSDETAAEETPVPASEVGTPADVEKSSVIDGSEMVEKLVKEALDEQSAAHAAVVKSLEDRIAHLEAPAQSKVLANGALPPAHLLRGQDAGGSPVTDASFLRKQMEEAPDAVTKAEAGEQMRIAALEALTALRLR